MYMSNIVSILSSTLGFFHLILSFSSLYFREYRYCYSDIRDSLSLSLSLRGALIKIFVKKTVPSGRDAALLFRARRVILISRFAAYSSTAISINAIIRDKTTFRALVSAI